MVAEAEENAEADKVLRERVEARNQLESYLYSLRHSVDESLKDKLSAEEATTLGRAVTEALGWLEEHPAEDREAYDGKRKEVEAIANPIIAKAYNGAAPSEGTEFSGPGEEKEDAGDSGPTVEEVD
jgi:molecular chaperone DnaK (HSP70)